MKYHIESIFKVMPYYLARSWKMQRYPVLKTDVLETLYMRTLEEAGHIVVPKWVGFRNPHRLEDTVYLKVGIEE